MQEHEPTRNLMQILFGMIANRFTETGRCKVCGDEWQYSGASEAELKRGIAEMGNMCPYCESADDEERERMKEYRSERSGRGKGILGFLFGL